MKTLCFILLMLVLISCDSETYKMSVYDQRCRGVMVGDTLDVWVEVNEHRSFYVEDESIVSILEQGECLRVLGEKIGQTCIIVSDNRADYVIGHIPVCVTNPYICLGIVGDDNTPEELGNLGYPLFVLVSNGRKDCFLLRYIPSEYRYSTPIMTGSYSLTEDASVISFDLTGEIPDYKVSFRIVSGDNEVLKHMSDILQFKNFNSYLEVTQVGTDNPPFHMRLLFDSLKQDDYTWLMQ